MILKRPLISEKSMDLVKRNMYTFEVSNDVSKEDIRKEVTERFKVSVLSVKTLNRKGKIKLQRSRKGYFQNASSKRAFVVLAKGDKIPLFEQNKEAEVTTAENTKEVKEKKNLLKGTKVKIEKKVSKVSKDSKEPKGKKKAAKKGGK